MMNMESRTRLQIPARMVNEYTYCPRLFYLEYVQQEWAHSVDTIDGRFAHRRVDEEKGRAPAAEELSADVQLHARSVSVGSDRIGAIARIDLIEGDAGKVIPVDYKRGAMPDLPEGAWEPERVQVCLQGLLLRDNGYLCDEGAIYYVASQQRVRVPLTETLIARTLELLEAARVTADLGVIPPPLIQSPKCPRCSLAGICLPDETNLLSAIADDSQPIALLPSLSPLIHLKTSHNQAPMPDETAGAAPAVAAKRSPSQHLKDPRRLMPARDDRLAVYVQGQGFSIGLKGEVLEIRDKGKAVSQARLLEISQLNLFGNVQLSAQALRELAGRDIAIVHLSYGGWLTAVTTPPPHKNIELRRRQFQAAEEGDTCLHLARKFVSGKIRNTRTLLRRNGREFSATTLNRLDDWRKRAEQADNQEELLGLEGMAARDYFSNFALMFKKEVTTNQPAFDFTSRNRRPPRDPVNALLSFLYAMLSKDMLVTLVGVGFDPYLGFYHKPRYGRPALALDVMEEFRPLVADSVAISMINNNEIRQADFVMRAGATALNESGRKRVIEAYERRLDTLVTHPQFGYAISYRRIFEVQVRLLARFLTGEIAFYPPFCTR